MPVGWGVGKSHFRGFSGGPGHPEGQGGQQRIGEGCMGVGEAEAMGPTPFISMIC